MCAATCITPRWHWLWRLREHAYLCARDPHKLRCIVVPASVFSACCKYKNAVSQNVT